MRVHWATGGAHSPPAIIASARARRAGCSASARCPATTATSSGTYSNLPADTPLQRLVALAHSRWPIEQFYEDAKGECGLDDYQGRRWDGLHRHLALVMLAYSFLACQRWMPAAPAGFSPSGSVRRSRRSIARCSCGSSKMWCYGLWRPIRLRTSAPGESNEVVLGVDAQRCRPTGHAIRVEPAPCPRSRSMRHASGTQAFQTSPLNFIRLRSLHLKPDRSSRQLLLLCLLLP